MKQIISKAKLPRSGALHLHRRQLGLTLIEFLIAITLGMMIVAALTLLIAQQSATQAEFEKSSRQIENGRYAIQILSDDVQMAGYYGEFSRVNDPTIVPVPGALPDPCSEVVTDIAAAMPFAVQGYDYDSSSAAVGLGTCINLANHKAGTDILVIRRLEPEPPVAVASAAAGQVYLQTGLDGDAFTMMVRNGANKVDFTLKDNSGTVSPLRKFLVHIYFVSPCSVPAVPGGNCSPTADGGKPIPTLKMVELSAAGTMTTLPLVEGIENLQIDYGFDTTGDGSPDGQFKATAAAGDWSNVMALRVHLLARNTESSAGYVDNKTYAMGYNSAASAQTVTAANDVKSFKRRAFSQMIRLVNPSGRLDR